MINVSTEAVFTKYICSIYPIWQWSNIINSRATIFEI